MVWLSRLLCRAGSTAPDFDLSDLSGRRHSRDTLLEGRCALLLAFFYLACAPCVAAFPMLERLGDAHGAHGLGVVAISRGDTLDALRRFADAHARHALLLTAPDDDPVFLAYRVFTYPTTCLINSTRRIAHRQSGGDAAAWQAALARQGIGR